MTTIFVFVDLNSSFSDLKTNAVYPGAKRFSSKLTIWTIVMGICQIFKIDDRYTNID